MLFFMFITGFIFGILAMGVITDQVEKGVK
jgi:hypothetical protein